MPASAILISPRSSLFWASARAITEGTEYFWPRRSSWAMWVHFICQIGQMLSRMDTP
ncbi:hypothetical protein D3C78_1941020 [compost metagenome]